MTTTLNQGQQAAAEAFFKFLFEPEKEMIISGPGGVGKSFLMGHMIDQIMPRYFDTCNLMGIRPEYDEVQMTATTNKAAEVLGAAAGRPTSTLHSFLGVMPKEDYKTGVTKLVETKAYKIHERTILFIDESSMIDSMLDQKTQQAMHKCKIVYVGDHCQLAPITEKLSPIYRRNLPFYELTEQMRNSGQPALMQVCQQLRNTVETGEFHPIQLVPGVIDHLDDQAMQDTLDQMFLNQDPSIRILAYTNDRVIASNDHIRSLRNLPDHFTIGEMLVNNTAIETKKRMLSVEEQFTLVQQGNPETVQIDKDVGLLVRPATLRSGYGELIDVQLPEDRNHFHALMKFYARKKNWERLYALKKKYPDLRQRDAATVHKSQGSTYDTVFIDLGDISTCHHADQVARMLYVAFSRARTRVFLFGNLASKYGGLLPA